MTKLQRYDISSVLYITKRSEIKQLTLGGSFTVPSAIGNLGIITNAEFLPSTVAILPLNGEYSVRIGTDGTLTLRKNNVTTSASDINLFATMAYL